MQFIGNHLVQVIDGLGELHACKTIVSSYRRGKSGGNRPIFSEKNRLYFGKNPM